MFGEVVSGGSVSLGLVSIDATGETATVAAGTMLVMSGSAIVVSAVAGLVFGFGSSVTSPTKTTNTSREPRTILTFGLRERFGGPGWPLAFSTALKTAAPSRFDGGVKSGLAVEEPRNDELDVGVIAPSGRVSFVHAVPVQNLSVGVPNGSGNHAGPEVGGGTIGVCGAPVGCSS